MIMLMATKVVKAMSWMVGVRARRRVSTMTMRMVSSSTMKLWKNSYVLFIRGTMTQNSTRRLVPTEL